MTEWVPGFAAEEWSALTEALEVAGPGGCEGSAVPEAWWPSGSRPAVVASAEEAKAVCRSCPVRRECLAYAVAADERDGIWGGLDAVERGHGRRAS